MKYAEMNKQNKGLYTLAMANLGIWAIAMIALIILLEKGGNLKGMFVIFISGTGIGIQILSRISNLKNE
jgi:uncharacterized membrane protein YpjA